VRGDSESEGILLLYNARSVCVHSREEHTDVGGDQFGKITAALGLSTWTVVFLAMTAILETEIGRLNWLDDTGRVRRTGSANCNSQSERAFAQPMRTLGGSK
jgi:hypothetical protein